MSKFKETNNSKSFDRISQDYDSLWYFSAEYQAWMLKNILSNLLLSKDSIFADIGGGTGVVTTKLVELSGIAQATCVEPSPDMLEQARRHSNLICENMTAEEFAKTKSGFTHILIKETIHHVKSRVNFLRTLKEQNPTARTLIVTRPSRPGFLLFEKAYSEFRKNQPSLDTLLFEISSAGLHAEVKTLEWPVSLPKEQWFKMLRARFISDLFKFSNEEIETGIAEIDRDSLTEQIQFNDSLIFIIVN